MYEIIDTRYDRVRCLERIVMDNEIGKGLGITDRWNGNGVQKLALESIRETGGDEAIKSLKRITSDACVSKELKIYASELLESLVRSRKNKKLDKAPV